MSERGVLDLDLGGEECGLAVNFRDACRPFDAYFPRCTAFDLMRLVDRGFDVS